MSATKTIQKTTARKFGSISAPAPNAAIAAGPRLEKVGAIPFADIEPTHFRLGPPIIGSSDKHCKLTTAAGGPVRFTTGVLPQFSFIPFGAGPLKDKDGKTLNPEWRMAFEVSAEDVAGLDKFDAWVKTATMPNATTLLPGKNGKPVAYNDDTLADKFNASSRPGKDGHPSLFSASIQHVPFDAEGRARRMPTIQKAILDVETGTMTAPEPATPDELTRGLACVANFAPSRGAVYYGQTGFGCKWTVESILLFPNIMKNAAPPIDTSGITIVAGSCADLVPAAAKPADEDPVAPGGEIMGPEEADQFGETE